jgi:hypothetical protein
MVRCGYNNWHENKQHVKNLLFCAQNMQTILGSIINMIVGIYMTLNKQHDNIIYFGNEHDVHMSSINYKSFSYPLLLTLCRTHYVLGHNWSKS